MSFDPFVVECTTCAAPLRVTDPALVGAIHACPKCGSMVQINLPPASPDAVTTTDPPTAAVAPDQGRVEMGNAQVDSEAVTQEAIVADPAAEAFPPSSGFADDEIQQDGPPPMAGGGPMAPPQWQSESTTKTKQIALVIAVSVVGLIVAAAAFSLFVQSWSESDEVSRVDAPDSDAPNTSPDSGPPSPDLVAPANDDPDSIEAPSAADLATETDPAEADPAEADPAEADPAEADSAAGDAAAKATSEDASVADSSIAQTNVIGMETSPEIPTDLLPQSPILGSPAPADPAEPEDAGRNEELGTLSAVPDDLRQFTDLLNVAGITPQGPELLESEPEELVDVEAASVEVIDPMMIATPPEPINIDVAMKFRVAIKSAGYPASDFVLFLSQITAVPIQLDWAAFDLLGIDVRQTHLPPSGMKTNGDHLQALLATLNAKSEADEFQVTITPTDELFAAGIARIADLADFGDSQQSVVSVLNAFLGREPGLGDDGKPQLNLGDTREDKLFSVLAVEAIRRMRGLPGKVPDAVIRRWSASYPAAGNGPGGTDWSGADWGELQGGETRPQVDAPISVAQMLRQTARLNQATCVINWADANRRQMSPEQLVMPLAGRGAAAMLENSLGPLGLQVRSVGKNFWWVGTAATYDRLSVVAWTSPLGDERERFTRRLSQALAKAKVAGAAITHDPQSDRLIMLVPRFILRQMSEIQSAPAGNAAQP